MRKERERAREKEKEAAKKADRSKQSARSNPKQGWIRFFAPDGTPDANEAAREFNHRQLLVHGLPSEFPTGAPGGPQEDALNTLIKSLGIILEQGHVVGAHPVEPTTSNDKSPVIRLTMNSKETKETLRKAAEATNRWGTAGNHKVFLRETTTKRRRTPSTEDSRRPIRTRPCNLGGAIPISCLAKC